MADMKVAMTLTVQDLGTVKLQQFNDALKSVGDQVAALNDRFKAAIAGASDFGKATSDAADGVTALSRASFGASRSTGRLADTLKVMQDALAGMGAKLAEVADNMAAMSASTADMASASRGAAAGIAAMGDAAGAADAKMAGMHGTMKGLLELYGALKTGEGLKKSVEGASSYQQERAQMQLMGIPKAARTNMLQQAAQLQRLPGMSKLSGLEVALAGYAAVPGAGAAQTQLRTTLLPEAARAAMVLKSGLHDKSPLGTIVRNILGVAEMTGHLENAPKALAVIRQVLQIAEGSHGKVTPRDLETSYRNIPYGGALSLSKTGRYVLASLHEQMKAAGGAGAGGNTKAGTISGMLQAMQAGGGMSIFQAKMLENLGLLNSKEVLKVRGTSRVWVPPGILPGSAEGTKNPIAWAHDVLLPAIRALVHKQNPNATPKQMKRDIINWDTAYSKVSGGANVGTGLALINDQEQYSRLMNTAAQMKRSAAPTKGIGILQHTLAFKQKEMLAHLETVGVQIGTALLPALTALAHWVSVVAQAITSLNTHWPIFKSIEAWAGALAALLLGIKGVEWLMGIKDAFSAIKGVQLAGTLVTWAAKATLGEEAVAGLASGLGGLGAVIAGLAGPITLAIAAIAAFGYAAYSMRHQLESGWSEFKHYLHPHAYPLPGHGPVHLGLVGAASAHWGGASPIVNHSLLNEQAHMAAMTAAAASAPGLGYTGPVTAAGLAKGSSLAAKHAAAIANAHQKAIDHLFAIADKAAAKATAVAAKMNAAAVKLHLAFMAMTNPLGAKIAGVNLKYGGIATEMTKAGHPGAAADALAIGHHKVLQYQYQGAMQHLSALKGNLHQTLTNTAALVTTGSLTKMQAAQQTIQEQKAAAPAMIQAADAAIKYAKALGDPKLVQALQIQRTHLQAMGQQLGYYAAKVKNTTQHAMTGLFENMMHGQKTWGQMFGSFFASIGKSLENTLAQAISQAIAKSLFTKKTGGAINSIFSLLGSAFSGGSSGSSSSPFAGAAIGAPFQSSGGGSSIVSGITAGGTFLKDLFSVIGSFAVGADNIPNDMVAQIHKGEMIIPAGPAEAIRSGASAGHTLNLTVHAMDSQSVMGALHSVRAEATQLFMNTASHLNYNGG